MRTKTKTSVQPVAPLPRQRGDFVTDWDMDGYGYLDGPYTTWTANPEGRLVTSALPDGRHAPVLDIDVPIRVESDDTGAPRLLVFQGRVRDAARIMRALNRLGLVPDDDRFLLWYETKTRQYRWGPLSRQARDDCRGGVQSLPMPFPMTVQDSRTPGHHHLYVEEAMPWKEAYAYAQALGHLVDRKWLRHSTEHPGMAVKPV